MKNLLIITSLFFAFSFSLHAQQAASNLDQLLDNVEQGKILDNAENRKRENEFRQKRSQQEQLLDDAVIQKESEEVKEVEEETRKESSDSEDPSDEPAESTDDASSGETDKKEKNPSD